MSSKGKFENMLEMLRNYVRQETVEPLKFLFGSVLFLFIGSLFISLGLISISIGLVGFLQRFEGFQTWFSWVPYLSGSLSLLGMAFFVIRILIVKKGRDV